MLLDEFDAIARRRDDDSDVDKLKCLVNVLLQALDGWPANSLLIAATNHGNLPDPAVWQRFDHVVAFDLPWVGLIVTYLNDLLLEDKIPKNLAALLHGESFSSIGHLIRSHRQLDWIENSG